MGEGEVEGAEEGEAGDEVHNGVVVDGLGPAEVEVPYRARLGTRRSEPGEHGDAGPGEVDTLQGEGVEAGEQRQRALELGYGEIFVAGEREGAQAGQEMEEEGEAGDAGVGEGQVLKGV